MSIQTDARRVLRFIETKNLNDRPITSVNVMTKFPRENKYFGRQRWASRMIAQLRFRGFLQDCERCEHCGRALTRGKRNVCLYITANGQNWLHSREPFPRIVRKEKRIVKLHTYRIDSLLTHQGITREFQHLRSARSASRAIDKTIVDLRAEGFTGSLSLYAEGEEDAHDYSRRAVEI